MNKAAKQTLPRLDINSGINHSPHVVILGAGASRACCPKSDKNGRSLPVMSDLVNRLGIEEIVKDAGYDPAGNFESTYSAIHRDGKAEALQKMDKAVRGYFSVLELPDTPTLYDYLVLSLRPKDLIVTFNWDPLLPQAFRRWRHLGPVLPQMAFLHGNVDIWIDPAGRRCRFASDARSVMVALSQANFSIQSRGKTTTPIPLPKISGIWRFGTCSMHTM